MWRTNLSFWKKDDVHFPIVHLKGLIPKTNDFILKKPHKLTVHFYHVLDLEKSVI